MLIYPYKLYSGSARALSKALGIKKFKENSPLHVRMNRFTLNWGNPRTPIWNSSRWLNTPNSVRIAADKLESFRALSRAQVSAPEWTTDRAIAIGWLTGGSTVVARTVLNGSGGVGIHLAENAQDRLVEAPLYVKYIKKLHEYRVHVFKGEVIDTQIKKKKQGVEREGTRIRNLANGYIFAREGIVPDERRDTLAVSAVAALGLDFGAVDLVYNRHSDAYYVLEVNTAPGLEGTTLTNYVNAIRKVM